MLLNELFEAIDTTVKTPKRKLSSLKLKQVGSGSEATAYETKSGNAVIKHVIIRNDIQKHAYSNFLKIIKDHPDNPFFPRIYSAKWYNTDPSDQTKVSLIVKMEKLIELNSNEFIEFVPTLFRQIGIDKNVVDNMFTTYNFVSHGHTIFRSFSDPTTRQELVKNSKNAYFVEAMQLIEPLFDKHLPDFHFGNIMIRQTSKGPQLVFADPFYG